MKNLFKYLNFYTAKAEAITKNLEFKTYTNDELKIAERKVGAKVEIVKEDGSLETAPDGTYEMEDSFVFIVKDGLIESIEGEEEPAQDAPATDMAEAETVEPSSDVSAELSKMKEYMTQIAAKVDELVNNVNQINDVIKAQETQDTEMAEMKKNMTAMYEAVKIFAKVPAQDSKVVKPMVVADSKDKARADMVNVFNKIYPKK